MVTTASTTKAAASLCRHPRATTLVLDGMSKRTTAPLLCGVASSVVDSRGPHARSFHSLSRPSNSGGPTVLFLSRPLSRTTGPAMMVHQRRGFSSNTKRDFYETLGVARSADKGEIKKAYFKLAKMHHPDTNQVGYLSSSQETVVFLYFRSILDSKHTAMVLTG